MISKPLAGARGAQRVAQTSRLVVLIVSQSSFLGGLLDRTNSRAKLGGMDDREQFPKDAVQVAIACVEVAIDALDARVCSCRARTLVWHVALSLASSSG